MAEPNDPIAAPVAPAPTAAPEAAPALAPEPVAPAPEPAPAAIPEPAAPVVEAPAEPAADALKPHTETPTLLDEGTKPVEAKEGEAPGEPKAPEPPKPEAPAPVKFEPYKLPEGLKPDEARITAFNEILTKELPPQERGQALLDMHREEMEKYDHQLRQAQHDAFAQTRAGWRKEVMADPELGGSGFRTAMTAVAKMRDMFVSREKPGTDGYKRDTDAFNQFMLTTGAGDNPAMLRFVHNIARRFDEPAAPPAPYKPPPDIGQKPGTRGRLRDLYQSPG